MGSGCLKTHRWLAVLHQLGRWTALNWDSLGHHKKPDSRSISSSPTIELKRTRALALDISIVAGVQESSRSNNQQTILDAARNALFYGSTSDQLGKPRKE